MLTRSNRRAQQVASRDAHLEGSPELDKISRALAAFRADVLGVSGYLDHVVSAIGGTRLRLLPGGPPDAQKVPAPRDLRSAWALLRRPAILGFVATLAIALGAAQPSSPFTLKEPGAWFFGIPGATARPGQGVLLGVVAVYGGMLLLFRVWYSTARLLSRRPGMPVAALAIMFVIWVVPLLVAPPLFSKDVYSYAAQGEMVSHHISPYQYGPSVLGAGPYVSPVDPLWRNAPAPYGTLFLWLSGAITGLTGHNELATVVGLRLLALLGVVIAAVFIPRLARSYGRDESLVFALAILNPITLLHLIGGAHNDALMAGLLVAGLALAKTGRPVLGVVACALAAAVKAPAAIGIVYIGWDWMGPGVGWRVRLRPVITSLIVGTGVLAILARATGLGWGWLGALGTPGTVKSWLSPATAVGMVAGDVAHLLGITTAGGTFISLSRAAGLGLALVIGVVMLLLSDRIGSVRAIAVTLLAFVVLGPVVQPWYLAWGLIVLAVVATSGPVRTVLLWLSILASFIGLPGGRLLLDELAKASLASVLVALLILLAIPTTPLATWGRRVLGRLKPDASIPGG